MAEKYIKYESLDEGRIARITLNRVNARNAQNRGLLVELGEAFEQAEADDQVRVVILAGAGPMFSSGHDLGSKDAVAERTPESRTFTRATPPTAGPARAPRIGCSRSGITSSRTR